MRCAILIFAAVVGAAAGRRYDDPSISASYALPASVTSAVAASRLSSEGTTTAAVPTPAKASPTNASPTTTTLAAEASSEVDGGAISESTTEQAASSTNTALTSVSSTTQPQVKPPQNEEAGGETLTELPIASPPTVLLPPDSDADAPQRRVVTYDQRQEGQYNIRADLENFMIVLIPPSPSEGLNLLDLLTKSALRRNTLRSKSKRKHFRNGADSTKYRHPLKSSATLPTSLQYVGRQQSSGGLDGSRGYLNASPFPQTPFDAFIGAHGSPSSVLSTLAVPSNRLTDFIEGRTTSRFDIAASEEDASADLHPDRPVDVLPPPYPLAYQHLIKPYHLEAEPTVIQALPPPELNSATARISGNYLDSYNQLLAPGLSAGHNAATGDVATISTTTTTSAAIPTDSNTGYYRLSRAIRGDSYLDTNRVNSLNSIHQSDMQPIYRADHSLGATYLYPPIDTPRLYFNPESSGKGFEAPHDAVDRSQVVDDVDDNARVGEMYVPPRELKDDIEWEQFFDSIAKEANDSLCLPGQRRDSYGRCRQVEGY
ncbi:uncharacterized protein LOC101456594 [Ceratitis capitata]|uniref:(Mediterranean fruit fly) hypothetical protein n=1 Tax=Ceratitis capitata TaxID=7213 RepID=W8CCV5_CERCA|nr:uncharacterized protein LOC101456594 [Ceratitis capitata]CAD6997470.1 unnamed protein product [Ceratitis capitata]